MRAIATDVAWSVCLCVLVTPVSLKADEPIVSPFVEWIRVDPRNRILDRGADPPVRKGPPRGRHVPTHRALKIAESRDKLTSVMGAVDDVADPRVVNTLHVELIVSPVASHDQMIGVQSSRPTVNDSHLIRTANHYAQLGPNSARRSRTDCPSPEYPTKSVGSARVPDRSANFVWSGPVRSGPCSGICHLPRTIQHRIRHHTVKTTCSKLQTPRLRFVRSIAMNMSAYFYACPRTHLKNHVSKLHEIFCASCMWP